MWLLALLAVLPPFVLAALPPRTEKWRRARKMFWIASGLLVALGAAGLAFVNPLGPAAIWMGTLFALVTALAFWLLAVETIRTERGAWRAQRTGKVTISNVPGRDPSKPWNR